jgi:hypothetical protein
MCRALADQCCPMADLCSSAAKVPSGGGTWGDMRAGIEQTFSVRSPEQVNKVVRTRAHTPNTHDATLTLHTGRKGSHSITHPPHDTHQPLAAAALTCILQPGGADGSITLRSAPLSGGVLKKDSQAPNLIAAGSHKGEHPAHSGHDTQLTRVCNESSAAAAVSQCAGRHAGDMHCSATTQAASEATS